MAGVKLGLCFLLWYGFNKTYNVYNAQLLKLLPLPWTVTCLHLGVGVLCVLLTWLTGLRRKPMVTAAQQRQIFPIAIVHVIGHLCNVLQPLQGPLSPACHLVRSCEAYLTALLGWILMGHHTHLVVLLSLVPVTAGAYLAATSALDDLWSSSSSSGSSSSSSSMGSSDWSSSSWPLSPLPQPSPQLMLSVAATVCFVLRALFAARVMRTSDDSMPRGEDLYAIITTLSFVASLPFALIMEGTELPKAYAAAVSGGNGLLTGGGGAAGAEGGAGAMVVGGSGGGGGGGGSSSSLFGLVKCLVTCGFSFYLYNEVSLIVLTVTSPMTRAVMSSVRRGVGLLLFAILLADVPATGQALGGVLAVVGWVCFITAEQSFTLIRERKAKGSEKSD